MLLNHAATPPQRDLPRAQAASDLWMGLTTFVACHLLGLWLATLLPWRIPGSVWGLLLLWAALAVNHDTPATLSAASATFLRYLPVIILPAGVGLMRLPVDKHWCLFVGACLLSWFAALWLSAKVGQQVFAPTSQLEESN